MQRNTQQGPLWPTGKLRLQQLGNCIMRQDSPRIQFLSTVWSQVKHVARDPGIRQIRSSLKHQLLNHDRERLSTWPGRRSVPGRYRSVTGGDCVTNSNEICHCGKLLTQSRQLLTQSRCAHGYGVPMDMASCLSHSVPHAASCSWHNMCPGEKYITTHALVE